MKTEELKKAVERILESPVRRELRNNMLLLKPEDVAEMFDIGVRDVQERFGHWAEYPVEVVEKASQGPGAVLRFPDGQRVEIYFKQDSSAGLVVVMANRDEKGD